MYVFCSELIKGRYHREMYQKLLVVLNVFLVSSFAYGEGGGIKVSCSIKSEGYLSKEPVSLLTSVYELTGLPTRKGGRQLIYSK